jgi:hypothetical protein
MLYITKIICKPNAELIIAKKKKASTYKSYYYPPIPLLFVRLLYYFEDVVIVRATQVAVLAYALARVLSYYRGF